MAKEIRITFKEKEIDLYNYVQSKSSVSAFLKNLAAIEKQREEAYIYGITKENINEPKVESNNYDIDISDLG